jgi:hypothetical protein
MRTSQNSVHPKFVAYSDREATPRLRGTGSASAEGPGAVVAPWARRSGAATYRAFLLPGCPEFDLAFTPAAHFGAVGPHFRTVFGEPVRPPPAAGPDPDHLIGLAWHHVLHARICIERNRLWQAEYWISASRDHALALACLRLDRPALHAKGVDGLPPR